MGNDQSKKNCPNVKNTFFSNDEIWLGSKDTVGMALFHFIFPAILVYSDKINDETDTKFRINYNKMKENIYDYYVVKNNGIDFNTEITNDLGNSDNSSVIDKYTEEIPKNANLFSRDITVFNTAINTNIEIIHPWVSIPLTPDVLSQIINPLNFFLLNSRNHHNKKTYSFFNIDLDLIFKDDEEVHKKSRDLWREENLKVTLMFLDKIKKRDGWNLTNDNNVYSNCMMIVSEMLEEPLFVNVIDGVDKILEGGKLNILSNKNLYLIGTGTMDQYKDEKFNGSTCLYKFYQPIEGFSNITEFFTTGKARGYTTKDEKLTLGLGLGLGIPLLIFMIFYFSMTKKQSKVIALLFGRRK
jgi:hypothetical protein